jgi:hypothetical protein
MGLTFSGIRRHQASFFGKAAVGKIADGKMEWGRNTAVADLETLKRNPTVPQFRGCVAGDGPECRWFSHDFGTVLPVSAGIINMINGLCIFISVITRSGVCSGLALLPPASPFGGL